MAKAKAERIKKIVAAKRAKEAARLAAIKKADDEEQAKVAAMSFGEAAEYMREHDGKKAEEDARRAEEKAKFEAQEREEEEARKAAEDAQKTAEEALAAQKMEKEK